MGEQALLVHSELLGWRCDDERPLPEAMPRAELPRIEVLVRKVRIEVHSVS